MMQICDVQQIVFKTTHLDIITFLGIGLQINYCMVFVVQRKMYFRYKE